MNSYQKFLHIQNQIKILNTELDQVKAEIYTDNMALIEAKGQGTISAERGNFKVSITTKHSASWDKKQLNSIKNLPFTKEYKVNQKQLDNLKIEDPDLYGQVEACLTTKPAKPTFKVEEVAE